MKGDKVEIFRKNGDEYVRHSYPYFSLPLLEKCHVHPKFAIFDAGMKMRNFISEDADGFKKNHWWLPQPSNVQLLYRCWIQDLPGHAPEDTTYVDPDYELVYGPPEHDTSDDTSDDTASIYLSGLEPFLGVESGPISVEELGA